ncbi:TVP38/TMEM64 family protein [Microaerobacter geothermalis]|uniref:TVP38/TMEM64 family protein n=1 Tax=Microaerobacter geothermalis TaxID=674972 RepID=UPI001F3B3B1E|nr:TVP38/TMEM64 family protein [Microaerobacter geothermalis]MCF6094929.1 TVP38/TMEM64 family protein [Microaerobacter geothermalis]
MKKIIAALLLFVGSGFILWKTGFIAQLETKNVEQIADYIHSFGWVAIFFSILLVLLQTFFPFIPFVLLAGANVIVFGLAGGYFLSWISSVAGAVIGFLFARYIGRDWAVKKMGKYAFYTRFNQYAKENGFLLIFLGRLIPIIPSSLVNTAAGLTEMRGRTFFWGTFFGKMPMVFLESLMGYDLVYFEENKGRLLILLGLFTVLLIIGQWIRIQYFSLERREEK